MQTMFFPNNDGVPFSLPPMTRELCWYDKMHGRKIKEKRIYVKNWRAYK
jgi:hypothetical protein